MLSSIFSVGTNVKFEPYLNTKIKVSNQIAFLSILLVGIPFIFIFYVKVPELVFSPILAIVITLTIPLFNLIKFQNVARFIASISGTLTIGITHGFLVEKGSAPLPASLAFELAFSVLPFIVFHPKEKKKLIGAATFILVFIALYQWRIDVFEIEHQSIDFLKKGFIEVFSVISATLQIYLFLWIITSYNYKAEKKQEQLVNEMNDQNRKLKDSENILKHSLKTLDESKIAEQKRLWVTEGITKFAKILRSDLKGTEMFDKILSEIIKYINANQGAIYVIDQRDGNEEEQVKIKQVSCYAYNRKKFTEQILEPGEGLLGQCYFEQNVILLTEIPSDYVNITSGIGQATPKCLIIVPLKINDQKAGFLELASFEVFDKNKVYFLERISENLASFIINNRINERTTVLLSKSQEQTEIMRAQEEEMRQNFEELQATQEEMQRVQGELRKVKENLEVKLEQKLIELENYKKNIDVLMNTTEDSILYTTSEGKITMSNPRVVKMFGYKQDELTNQSINQLFSSDKKTLTDCFAEIKHGKSKFYEIFKGKSKMYGFEFPVEIKLGKGEDENNIIFSVMIRDISKRKKREESMQKSLAQMQKLQQTLFQKQQDYNMLKSTLEQKQLEIENLKAK